MDRFKFILSLLHWSPPHVDGGEFTFQSQSDVFKSRKLEDDSFTTVREIAKSPYAIFTLDDELVGTRAKDVQSKSLSDRKADHLRTSSKT